MARATSQRRASERQEFHSTLQKQIREISRSQSFRGLSEQAKDVVAALIAGVEESRERLESAIYDIEAHGTVIPLTGEIVHMARYFEFGYSLSPQDALVLASVKLHAENKAGPKCFVSQDAKGFGNPAIKDELGASGCKVLTNFADALAYVKSSLPPST